jgi:uncharacterized membrane protein
VSDLIILAFRNQGAAFVAGENLAALQQDTGTEPEDIVVVTRTAAGRIGVNHLTDLGTGAALGGGEWGTLIAMLFLDSQPVRTAKHGLVAQLRQAGIDVKFLEDSTRALVKSGAVVGMRVRLLGVDRVIERASTFKGSPKIIHTRLSDESEEQLIDMQGQIPQQVLALVQVRGSR